MKNKAAQILEAAGYSALGLGVVSGIGLVAYQCYVWLRLDVWLPMSVITALKWLDVPWAQRPSDWFGVHKVLEFFPLSLALPAFGVIVAASLASIAEDMRKGS